MKTRYQLCTMMLIIVAFLFAGCDFEKTEKPFETGEETVFSVSEEGIEINLLQAELNNPAFFTHVTQGSAKGPGMIQRMGSLRTVLAHLDKDAEYIVDESVKESVFKADLQFDEDKRDRAIELFLAKADSAFELKRVSLKDGDLSDVEERLVYRLEVENEELLSSHSDESELSTGQMSRVDLRRGELYAVQITVSELAEILSDQYNIVVHSVDDPELRFSVGLNLNQPIEQVADQLADEYGLALR